MEEELIENRARPKGTRQRQLSRQLSDQEKKGKKRLRAEADSGLEDKNPCTVM